MTEPFVLPIAQPEPGTPEAHLEQLIGKLHRQWEVLRDGLPPNSKGHFTDVRRDGDTVHAVLDGRPVTATIAYDDE